MRKENDHKSELVSQLLYGDCFSINEQKKGWIRITSLADDYSGWIDHKQYQPIDEEKAKEITFKDPAYSSQLVDYLENEKKLLSTLVLGSNIKAAAFLGHIFEGKHTAEKGSKSNLIQIASLYLNAPYLWGGKTPLGIDCSGLTQMTYRINGIALPRDAAQQAQLGDTLSFIDESEPGDLAFFDNDEGTIVHVGLLMENHYILHAHGKVRIDRIDQTGIYNLNTQQHSHKLRMIKKII